MRLLALLLAAASYCFADTDCRVRRDYEGKISSINCRESMKPDLTIYNQPLDASITSRLTGPPKLELYEFGKDLRRERRAREAHELEMESMQLDIELKREALERIKKAEEDRKNAESRKVVADWVATAKAKKAAKERAEAEEEWAAEARKVANESAREESDH